MNIGGSVCENTVIHVAVQIHNTCITRSHLLVCNVFLSSAIFLQHLPLIILNSAWIDPVFPCGPHNAIKVVKKKKENNKDIPTVLITNIPN